MLMLASCRVSCCLPACVCDDAVVCCVCVVCAGMSTSRSVLRWSIARLDDAVCIDSTWTWLDCATTLVRCRVLDARMLTTAGCKCAALSSVRCLYELLVFLGAVMAAVCVVQCRNVQWSSTVIGVSGVDVLLRTRCGVCFVGVGILRVGIVCPIVTVWLSDSR